MGTDCTRIGCWSTGWVRNDDIGSARVLIRRRGRLVAAVAKDHAAEVDSVFELARMLRVPGTFNNKPVA